MSIVVMLAAAGAVAGLWVGATRHTDSVARGYRWLGGAALFWCAGLIVDTVVAGSVSSSGEPLGLADVAPLLGLAAAATGIMVLASPSPSQPAARQGEHPEHGPSGSVLPGLADVSDLQAEQMRQGVFEREVVVLHIGRLHVLGIRVVRSTGLR